MADYYLTTSGSDSNAGTSEGAAFATIGKAGSVMAGGDTLYVKTGTYTPTVNTQNVAGGYINPPLGSSGSPSRIIGYHTTVGDLDDVTDFSNFPTIAAGSVTTYGVRAGNNYTHLRNLIASGGTARSFSVEGTNSKAINCKATSSGANGFFVSGSGDVLFRCAAVSCPTGYNISSIGARCLYCIATGSTSVGFSTNGVVCTFLSCLSYANTGGTTDGFYHTGASGGTYLHCISYGNGRAGIRLNDATSADTAVILNCILYGNGSYGDNSATTTWADGLFDYNFFGSNTSGARNGLPTGAHDVALSGDPFTNAASGDFSLNNTAGAGAAVRAAGFPGVFPLGLTTGYTDGGAAQHADPAGGGTVVVQTIQQVLMSPWRAIPY